MRSRVRGQRGVVTAELAVGMLAGAILLVMVAWGAGLGITQLRAMDAAAQIARLEARGSHDSGDEVLKHDPGARVDVRRDGESVTVTVELPAPGYGPMLPVRHVTAEATTLAEPGE